MSEYFFLVYKNENNEFSGRILYPYTIGSELSKPMLSRLLDFHKIHTHCKPDLCRFFYINTNEIMIDKTCFLFNVIEYTKKHHQVDVFNTPWEYFLYIYDNEEIIHQLYLEFIRNTKSLRILVSKEV